MRKRHADIYVEIEASKDHKSSLAHATLEMDFPNAPIVVFVDTAASAIREPQDKDNDEIGYLLAVGRALENISRKMQKRAWGLVRHEENLKKQKKLQQTQRKDTKLKKEGTN